MNGILMMKTSSKNIQSCEKIPYVSVMHKSKQNIRPAHLLSHSIRKFATEFFFKQFVFMDSGPIRQSFEEALANHGEPLEAI